MKGYGSSHGCVSVLNGIVSGIGAVIGTQMRTDAEYEITGDSQKVVIGGSEGTNSDLAEICVRRTLEKIGADPDENYVLRVDSQIPPSRGLKSSSSVCNAVVKAVLEAHGQRMDIMDAIELGVNCAREAKVTITGSFDDACGCELGGFLVTDNYNDRLLHREPAKPYDIVLLVPGHVKSGVPRERYNAVADRMEEIKEVCRTDVLKAMTMNGRLIAEVTGESGELIDAALDAGALAAGVSGTGPAVAAFAGKGNGRELADSLKGEADRILVTRTRRCRT